VFLLKICIWSIPLQIIILLIPPSHQFRFLSFAEINFCFLITPTDNFFVHDCSFYISLVSVRRLTTKKGPNLALHPIDLEFYILVLDTPITDLEPGCSRLLPSHHPCGENSPHTPLFHEVSIFGKNLQTKSVLASPESNLEPLIDHSHLPLWRKVAPCFAYFVDF